MTTSTFSSATTGWAAILTAAIAILAVIFLALMAAVNPAFGKVNDVFNSLIGIACVILAWLLYAKFHAGPQAQIGLGLALAGAVFTIIGSILIIFGFTGFVLAGWYTGIGNALIGLWLAIFCYAMLRGGGLPHNLTVFGLVVAAFMAFGFLGIPGIIARIDRMDTLPWYLYLAFMCYLGTYILFPIWAILLGRTLLLK
jgi:hypothetical protein